MRIALLLSALALVGCATGGSGADDDRTRTSIVSLRADGSGSPSQTIEVRAGEVRLRHWVPPGARLRATVLEGLDEANRHLRYAWTMPGVYRVEMSGRYRHSVSGSIVGSDRLTSTLTYTALPDPARPAESPPSTGSRWAADSTWIADLAWTPHAARLSFRPAPATTCEVAAFIGGGMVGALVGAVLGVTIERAIYEGEDAGVTGMAVGMIGGWILGSQLARRRCDGAASNDRDGFDARVVPGGPSP